MIKKLSFFFVATFFAATFFVAIGSTTEVVSALSGSDFKPGRIIDDKIFTDGTSMTVSEIQNFLEAKVPICDNAGEKTINGEKRKNYNSNHSAPFTCLKQYYENTSTRANNYGQFQKNSNGSYKTNSKGEYIPVVPSGSKSAAQIILDVGQAHEISPKVLIVTLQKEMSFITDDWPWDTQYQKAMGYGCPDTAPCDEQYYGFYNQVNSAARQFRRYMTYPDNYNYAVGDRYILYNPNASCGGSNVRIETAATAALYNYTPYQPNQAALNNLYGSGNNCSAYGNRNFWRIFNGWFGSTETDLAYYLFTCEGDKYLQELGVNHKRSLTSEAVSAWGFNESDFLTDSYLCQNDTYSLPLGRLLQSRNTSNIYVVDRSKAYHINNMDTAEAWGFGNVSDTTLPRLNGTSILTLQLNQELPRLAKSPNTNIVYFVDAGNRHPVSGTNINDDRSLKLVRGYDEVPMSIFSVSLLQTLTANMGLDFSFSSQSNWYLLNHNQIIKIEGIDKTALDSLLTGPSLSAKTLALFSGRTVSTNVFQRPPYYYRITSEGSLEQTSSQTVAGYWGAKNSPIITNLLENKILRNLPINRVNGLDDNIRLITCGDTPYYIERGVVAKRQVSAGVVADWGFEGLYFNPEDKGCNYPTFSLELENLLRSRNTGKVYYIENQTAYYVHSREMAEAWGFGDTSKQIYPQFDPESIHILRVEGKLPPPSS